jgi:hypothetical protein
VPATTGRPLHVQARRSFKKLYKQSKAKLTALKLATSTTGLIPFPWVEDTLTVYLKCDLNEMITISSFKS